MSDRRSAVVTPNLTIAQCIARSSDPMLACIASYIQRGGDRYSKWFKFEDGSELKFNVTYTVVQP